MVKHTQTIRRQTADELFERVWPFCEIGAKRVKAVNYFRKRSTLDVWQDLEYAYGYVD